MSNSPSEYFNGIGSRLPGGVGANGTESEDSVTAIVHHP